LKRAPPLLFRSTWIDRHRSFCPCGRLDPTASPYATLAAFDRETYDMPSSTERRALGFSHLARAGRGEIWLIAALLLAGALILGFGLLVEEVLEGDTSAFDRNILMALRNADNPAEPIGPPWLQEMGRDVTALGSVAFLGFVLIATVGYLLLIRKQALALLMTVAVLGGEILSTVLKNAIDRPRPDIPHGVRVFTASFPSGHAMLSAVTFLTLGALLARMNDDHRVKTYFMVLAVFLTIMVGLSRIYLGVHYPTDVLAGWCAGAAWAILCWCGAFWLQQRGKVEPASPSRAS
jgi:undecaprenyl-diphosphatase